MKNLIFFTVLFSLLCRYGFAQVLTVSNQTSSPGQYFSIQDAISAATPDDTIYVHGSPFSYGNIVVNKRLTFIGPGYNPQGQFTSSANIDSVAFDSIVPSSGGTGSRFIGLNIRCFRKLPIQWHVNNDVLIERCRIYGHTKSYVVGKNWLIRNNLFQWTASNSGLDIGLWNNIIISNNFFSFGPLATSTTQAIYNSNKSSVIINNNIFTGYHQGASFDNVSNVQFSNNIFFGKSPLTVTTSIFENNLTYGSQITALPYGMNSGQNNIINQDPLFTNVPLNTYTFNYAYNFQLQPSSPGFNGGTNGTDIGIFGGQYPMPAFGTFMLTGHPPLPQVYYLQLQNNVVDLSMPLDVTVKARKNDGVHFYTGEYFFDTDPGVGNGIPLSVFNPTPDTTLHLQILAVGLQTGPHMIYFRFKDTLDRWGLHARTDFFICDVLALADFSADTVCLGDSTTFTNLSTGGDTSTIYRWDVTGDGLDDVIHTGIIGGGAPLNFTYLFLTGGVHDVRLITDNGGGCSDTLYKQVLVLAFPPVPTPSGDDSLCINSTNQIYTIPQLPDATSYYWQLTPSVAGSFVVLPGDTAIEVVWNNTYTGTVQIIAGAAYGPCSSPTSAPPSAPLTVLISAPSVGGVISIIDSTICIGNSTGIMTLSGQTGSVLLWQKRCNGGAWTPIPASATTTYSETPPLSGTCQYRVMVKNGFCDSVYSSVATITINTPPDTAGVITGPIQICEGQQAGFSVPIIPGAVSYTWTLPFGATIVSGLGTDSIFVHFNLGATSGVVSVFATNACGQGASSSIGVTVSPNPIVTVTPYPDTTINCYTSANLSGTVIGGTPPFLAQWTPSIIVSSPNSISTSTVNLTNATIFTLTITDSLGCSSNEQVVVNVWCGPLSVVVISTPPIICAGDSSVLTANASGGAQPYTYQWSSNPGTFTSTLQNPVVSPIVTTTYTVTVSGGGQTTTATCIVNVNPLPEPAGAISGPSVVYLGQTGVNYSVPVINYATSYIWTLPQGFVIVSGNTTNSIIVNVSNAAVSGNVSVYGINNCGAGDSSALYPVTITTGMAGIEDFSLSIYPTLTSGKVYVTNNLNQHEALTIRLFNQFGAVVFEEPLGNETVHTFDFSCFSNGLYYLQIAGNTFGKTVKIGIQK